MRRRRSIVCESGFISRYGPRVLFLHGVMNLRGMLDAYTAVPALWIDPFFTELTMQDLPTVRDYMTADVHVLAPSTPIREAVDLLVQKRISGAPVLDESEQLIGVLTEQDCLSLVVKGRDHKPADGVVADFMTRNVESVPPSMDIYFAAGLFLSKPYRRYPVVEHGRLVGVISRHDVLKAVSTS
jgi:CBS domain-containing protein